MDINKIIENINNLLDNENKNKNKNNLDNIYIIHNDWNEICYLENNKIFRKYNNNNENIEYGKYNIKNNKLIINWEKWDTEKFYLYLENYNKISNIKIYLYSTIYYDLYKKIYILDKNIYTKVFLNKNSNNFYIYHNNRIIYSNYAEFKKNNIIIYSGKYQYNNNILILKNNNNIKKYKNLQNNNYIEIYNYENIFFEINCINKYYNNNIIFNKINNKFYNISNFKNNGIYKFYNYENIISEKIMIELKMNIEKNIKNKVKLYWNNNSEKIFDLKIENKIILIKPKCIFLNDKVLFSNISLCKNKIILTSLNYKKNGWIIENIKFNVNNCNNCNIIKRTEYANDDYYEVSLNIILELELKTGFQLNNLILQIFYENNNYEIYLEQLNIITHKISAMTLFKDDYLLLENYIKYYEKMGIEVFFLYYNGIIEDYLIEYINKINNEVNVIIYLIEWNYIYWYYYEEKMKHHCAQIMAICDSFNILKNYSKYVLYNDLDEYFLLDYGNFNNMITKNNDIDIFVFKNQFCKMGFENINYKDFTNLFNLTHVIEGNYWDKYREKNFIKLEHIKVMGIHYCFEKFNNEENIKSVVISKFYHITNFIEKDRNNLMTEYIM